MLSSVSNKAKLLAKNFLITTFFLDDSGISLPGPYCIPVVFLKNCEPELSFILRKLFKKCLKESCFLDCWKVSSAVPFFKNISEMSTAKTYRPVSFLSVVSQVFEKLVINKYFRSHRKMWAFL